MHKYAPRITRYKKEKRLFTDNQLFEKMNFFSANLHNQTDQQNVYPEILEVETFYKERWENKPLTARRCGLKERRRGQKNIKYYL